MVRVNRRLSEQEEHDRLVTRADLSALTQHPGWPRLARIVDLKEMALRDEVAGKVFRKGQPPMTDAEQAYYRGLLEGIRWFVRQPEAAARDLEKFLQQAAKEASEVG